MSDGEDFLATFDRAADGAIKAAVVA